MKYNILELVKYNFFVNVLMTFVIRNASNVFQEKFISEQVVP